MDDQPLTPPTITNVVVVMLENRSYDNVLGWLDRHAGAVPNLDSHGNSYAAHNAATTVVGSKGLRYPGTAIPVNDPSEVFGSMAQQYLGLDAVPRANPYGHKSESAPMTGFVRNYETAKKVGADSLPDVMNYFVAEQLPVTAFWRRTMASAIAGSHPRRRRRSRTVSSPSARRRPSSLRNGGSTENAASSVSSMMPTIRFTC